MYVIYIYICMYYVIHNVLTMALPDFPLDQHQAHMRTEISSTTDADEGGNPWDLFVGLRLGKPNIFSGEIVEYIYSIS